ncbi:undecaprenyldiphospho-muramoylpentapeptide beta-N-acetylglucosaminyltransferase [Owenweeksia hongkongensis]|uniref:undecaprenyldiphospho-muramoylpentapeptide beta-N-acetylglucosaminyltransferase n=1 Tax=Owenweeksia hongkongensis TaxID=253245 RepID=UPI003A8CF951
MPKYKFMISGGGTGGHIFPAIAIADTLKEMHPDSEFLFVGASDRMEMERVPQAGYKIEGLWISGIQRKLTASNLMFPFKLFSSITKCKRLIRKFKPDAVIGTGGFASGPLLYVAANKKITTLIQEQNSLPGITNKILAPKVNSICVAYDKMERFFPKDKILLTGNPIRGTVKNINSDRNAAISKFNLNPTRPTLLVLGGSLGARRINELIGNNLDALLAKGINILWQTGKLYSEKLQEQFGARQNDQLQIMPFIKNMEDAYTADIIISRAGAGTISELAVAEKATMLIPSPNVAEDHQTKNANALAEKGAALLFRESGTNDEFLNEVDKLIAQKSQLEINIKQFALPDAAKHIAEEVLKLVEKNAR